MSVSPPSVFAPFDCLYSLSNIDTRGNPRKWGRGRSLQGIATYKLHMPIHIQASMNSFTLRDNTVLYNT